MCRKAEILDWIDNVTGIGYAYDELGRLETITDYDGSTLTYAYDGVGNVTSVNDYHSNVTTYTYTDLHQVDTITAPGSKVWDFSYNANGFPTRMDLPNGMHTEYAYDDRNRLESITHKDGTTVEQSFDYTLNALSQITQIYHEDGTAWDYDYDDRGRLLVATRYDNTDTEDYREEYTYDDGDNMTEKEVTENLGTPVTTTYTVNNANELTAQSDGTTSLTFTYDAAGRQATKSDGTYTTTNSWRYGDLLEDVDTSDPNGTDVTYLYGGDGMRRERSDTDSGYTWYNYAGFTLVSEEALGTGTGDGALTRTYVGRQADAVGSNPATTGYRYYLHDHLGSTRSVYDQSKTRLGAWEPTPFGDPLTDTLPSDVLHRYTGHILDPVTDSYYAPYRYYAPGQSRWMKRDPLGMIDGPNMFGYVTNNPVAYFDPDGRAIPALVALGLRSLAGAAFGYWANPTGNPWHGALIGGTSAAVFGWPNYFASKAVAKNTMTSGAARGLKWWQSGKGAAFASMAGTGKGTAAKEAWKRYFGGDGDGRASCPAPPYHGGDFGNGDWQNNRNYWDYRKDLMDGSF